MISSKKDQKLQGELLLKLSPDHEYFIITSKQWPDHPLYVCGDSIGGLITRSSSQLGDEHYISLLPQENGHFYILSSKKWPDYTLYVCGDVTGGVKSYKGSNPGPAGYFIINNVNSDQKALAATAALALSTAPVIASGNTKINVADAKNNSSKDELKVELATDVTAIARYLPGNEVALDEVNVTGDGSCLPYSVIFSYLLPVLTNPTQFHARCVALFGQDKITPVVSTEINGFLQSYQGEKDYITTHNYAVLEKLVDVDFRQRFIQYMRDHKADFEEFIIDEPFETYLMRQAKPKQWCGHHEIKAISAMLKIRIEIYKPSSANGIFTAPRIEGENFTSTIFLIHSNNETHYHYLIPLALLRRSSQPIVLSDSLPKEKSVDGRGVANQLQQLGIFNVMANVGMMDNKSPASIASIAAKMRSEATTETAILLINSFLFYQPTVSNKVVVENARATNPVNTPVIKVTDKSKMDAGVDEGLDLTVEQTLKNFDHCL